MIRIYIFKEMELGFPNWSKKYVLHVRKEVKECGLFNEDEIDIILSKLN